MSKCTTFQSISIVTSIHSITYATSFEDHSILCQCPSFVTQNIFNLSKVLANSCAEGYTYLSFEK